MTPEELRDYIDQRITDLDRRLTETRIELDKVDDELQILRRERANLEGRQFVWSGVVSAIIAIFVALLAQWIR